MASYKAVLKPSVEKDLRSIFMGSSKLSWQGQIISVQPRIRLLRSFDQRSHSYLGYTLLIHGVIDGHESEFSVGIGQAAQMKFAFRVGDVVSGVSEPVADRRMESVMFYKTAQLKLVDRGPEPPAPPPWLGTAPDVAIYRQRGHRRLDPRTYESKCRSCIWGCRMPVEMIVDQWKPANRRYRFETFCYGPKSCRFYKEGPRRKVPGRRGMVWIEEDWIDEEATSHRGPDD